MMTLAGLAEQTDLRSNYTSNGISSSGVITVVLGLIIVIAVFIIPWRRCCRFAQRGRGALLPYPQDGNTSTDIVLTEEKDFHAIYEETITLKAKYYEFGIHLGLPPHELNAIQKEFPRDISQAFSQVLLLWLWQTHKVERYGPPTWEALVKAVEQENRALANKIAAKYLRTERGGNALTDVKHEIQQEKQKRENLVTVATDLKCKANEQEDEQKCMGETFVTEETDMKLEAHEQQHEEKCEMVATGAVDVGEIECKSLSQLQKDEKESLKQERIDNMFMNLSAAETVGVCFMIDRTVYAGPWIDKIKDFRYWSEQLQANHTDLELHVAFVLYTDYDQPPYTLDFTTDLEEFYRFIDELVLPADTRGDRAESVFAGLDAMLNLSWQKLGTKVLIHLADTPSHGVQYWHSSITKDDYPEGVPDHEELKLDDLVNRLADTWIAYHFGCINKSHTLAMIEAFNSSLLRQSHQHLSIQQLDLHQESDLAEHIFQSVTASIGSILEGLLAGVDRHLHEYSIDESIPHWDSLPLQQVMVTHPPTPGSLGASLKHPKTPMSVKIAPQPFAVGTQRMAYHALDVDQNFHMVIKKSKWADERSSCLKRCQETANVHAIAVLLFLEFKKKLLETTSPINVDMEKITLGTVGVMQWVDNDGQELNFTFDAYVDASRYTKFNSSFACIPNSRDYEVELNMVCQAFSHYTWSESGKQPLIVCDLQGKRDGSRVILTDPVIHDSTSVLYHCTTNLGEKGIQRFFQLHKCNEICQAMQLERPLSSYN